MTPVPPMSRDQRKIDENHIKLLAIFHFVGAGFALLGILFLLLHYSLMHALFANPDMWKNQKQPMPMPAEQVFSVMKWFYLAGAVWLVASAVLNLTSGLFLRVRRGRMFSLVVAGMNCLHIPLGTVLGVFTIIFLIRDSVRELYEGEGIPLPPASNSLACDPKKS